MLLIKFHDLIIHNFFCFFYEYFDFEFFFIFFFKTSNQFGMYLRLWWKRFVDAAASTVPPPK